MFKKNEEVEFLNLYTKEWEKGHFIEEKDGRYTIEDLSGRMEALHKEHVREIENTGN